MCAKLVSALRRPLDEAEEDFVREQEREFVEEGGRNESTGY